MSEIMDKISRDTEDLNDLIEDVIDCIKSEVAGGLANVDAYEMGSVSDILKDLCEAKYRIVRSLYFEQVMCAMEESDFGTDYDERGRIPRYSADKTDMGDWNEPDSMKHSM